MTMYSTVVVVEASQLYYVHAIELEFTIQIVA